MADSATLRSTTKRNILPKPKTILEFKNLFLDFSELPFPNEQQITQEKPEIMNGTTFDQLAGWFSILKYQAHIVLEERNNLKKCVLDLEQKLEETTKKSPNETVSTLETIIRKIDSVDTKLKFLAANGNIENSPLKQTYADAAKSNFPKTRAEHILITRQAILEEQQRPIREKSLVISNVKKDDADLLVNSLCEISNILSTSVICKSIGKNPNPNLKNIVLQLDTKENAQKVKKELINP